MLRLDTAVVHREGRVALLEAYKGTEVFGFEFPSWAWAKLMQIP